MNKTCTKCGVEKDVGEFGRDKYCKDGFCFYCKICKYKKDKKYNIKNKIKLSLKHKQYYIIHQEEIKQTVRDNYNPEKERQYRIKNKDRDKERNNKYRIKYNKDPNHKIIKLCRSRQYKVLKGISKSAHTMELIGCSPEFFKTYLFNRFYNDYPGLTLHLPACEIHHRVPCHTFDMSDPEQQQKCFHYSNVKLMPKQDHIELHNREGR